MKCSPALLLAVALIAAGPNSSLGQLLEVHVPDNTPASGSCGLLPWGTGPLTYAARVPSSFMNPAFPDVRDVAFAACSSGNWSSNEVQVALGHVPNPFPDPFFFPTITAGGVNSLGSFRDLTVVHDAAKDGPLTWHYVADTWLSLGFRFRNGTGFVWNGVDDLAIYVTAQGAIGLAAMHQTQSEPFQAVAPAVFQAGASTGGGPSGLKLRLLCGPERVADLPGSPPSSGICTSVPFGLSAVTYTAVLPSAALPLLDRGIEAISFAPCGDFTWSATQVQVGLGHLPTPLPQPFLYPQVAGGGAQVLGDFLDLIVLHDSGVQGPLTWAGAADQWSHLVAGGTGFTWNSLNDVGLYLTAQGTSGLASFHASGTAGVPGRAFAAGVYQAAASTVQDGAGLALRLRLDRGFELEILTSSQGSGIGVIRDIPAGTVEGWTLLSLSPGLPLGQGPLFGLFPDGNTFAVLGLNPVAASGNPLHWSHPAPVGLFPAVPFGIPAGLFPPGSTWDFLGLAVNAQGRLTPAALVRASF